MQLKAGIGWKLCFVTDNLHRPGRAVSQVCVCVSVIYRFGMLVHLHAVGRVQWSTSWIKVICCKRENVDRVVLCHLKRGLSRVKLETEVAVVTMIFLCRIKLRLALFTV